LAAGTLRFVRSGTLTESLRRDASPSLEGTMERCGLRVAHEVCDLADREGGVRDALFGSLPTDNI
jgi:hypothetical protein